MLGYGYGNLPVTYLNKANRPGNNFEKDVSSVDYGYKYPYGLNFKPGSELHEAIRYALLNRIRDSHNIMSSRYPSWKNIDEKLTTYIDLSKTEVEIKDEDSRKPVSMVLPLMFANREILLTYFMAAFLESPIFRYKPTSPEDIIPAILMTHLVDSQSMFSKLPLRLINMWSSAVTYGIAPLFCSWKRDMGYVTKRNLNNIAQFVPGQNLKPTREYVLKNEYNEVTNIDPYNYFPDVGVPPDRYQDAEYHSWIARTNLMSLLNFERANPDLMFNVNYLKHIQDTTSIYYNDDAVTGRSSKTGYYDSRPDSSRSVVDIATFLIELIPSDWGLGNGKYPERWIFRLAGDDIVTSASPIGLDHDRYPLVVDAPTADGLTNSPMAILELGYGLQETMDWLFSSHITNVRKSINDMLVVDPWLVNMDDVLNPGPGKLIRLQRKNWGRSLKDAVMQLGVADVTRTHVADIQFVASMQDVAYGTTEPLKGTRRRSGDRVTATEINSDRVAALSRFEKIGYTSYWQSQIDLAMLFASHTRQLMSQPIFVETIGRLGEDLFLEYGMQPPSSGFLYIEPEMILGDRISVQPYDGSVPGNTDANAWLQIFQIVANQPMLMQRFDLFRIFAHIARNLGAKNVRDFEVKVQPNQQMIQQQAQAGNFVPTGEFLNAYGGGEMV